MKSTSPERIKADNKRQSRSCFLRQHDGCRRSVRYSIYECQIAFKYNKFVLEQKHKINQNYL